MKFSDAKLKFDNEYRSVNIISKSLVTVDGKFIEDISIKDIKGKPNEEYYKWQFIYSLIASKLYPRDNIGTEIYFPKGNKKSAPLKIDAVIFESVEWIDLYRKYRVEKDQDALEKLRSMIVVVIEFKRNDKKIEQVFNSQIKASLKEPDSEFVLGIYYDAARLFMFKKIGNIINRYDNSKNYDYSQRILEKYQLEITDPYYRIPSLKDLLKRNLGIVKKNDEKKIEDLEIVQNITDENIKLALNRILKKLTSESLFNEEGYLILIQLIAMKIFDEKQSEEYGSYLRFYIEKEEEVSTLPELSVQRFINRMRALFISASEYYQTILAENRITWTNERHVHIMQEIVKQFGEYSFAKSQKSDLYQLVFYNFATQFKKGENAQFLTPVPIIDFITKMVNPKRNESICDPCCGIGDFLSVSYVNSDMKLNDSNLYGFDNDYNMTILAQLNMLLNGDGNAKIKYFKGKGSINHKLSTHNEIKELDSGYHLSGNWDAWVDGTGLKKYDVIMTNPPFGKGISLDLNKDDELEAAKFYELYDLYVQNNPKSGLDLGIVFLENTVRSIKTGGRFGIVLSGSISSNNTWKFAREWLLKHVRLVALIDLPENILAETGVNTTIIIGYKPQEKTIDKLIEENYSVFTREIKKVGYIKKTSNRNVVFENDYLLNEETFETIINSEGESIVNEDFTVTIKDFKDWCVFQELELKKLFLDDMK